MEGKQLIEMCERYTDEMFNMIPASVRNRMKISNINTRGSKTVEIKFKREKQQHASNLRQKRMESRADKDLEAFQELAAEKTTEHAELWPMKEERAQNEIMHEMLTKTWWNKVPARSFTDEVLRVITSMSGHREIVGKKKKEIVAGGHLFGKHLKEVKAAAKAAAKKSDDSNKKIEVDGDDLTGMKENEILKKYVDYEQSQHHSTSQTARKEEAQKLDRLFKLFRKIELAQQTRFSSEMTYGRKFEEGEKDDTDDDGDSVDGGLDTEIDEID